MNKTGQKSAAELVDETIPANGETGSRPVGIFTAAEEFQVLVCLISSRSLRADPGDAESSPAFPG